MYKKPKKNNICVVDDCNNPRHVLNSGRRIIKCKKCQDEDNKTRGKSLWKKRTERRNVETEASFKSYYLFSKEYEKKIAEY